MNFQKFIKKRRLSFLLSFLAIICGVFFFGASIYAQQQGGLDLGLNAAQATGLGNTDIRVTIANIIRVGIGLLGIIAVGFILYGGFLWMTSGGDQGKVDSARKTLINGTIGLAIILSAYAIASFVLNSLVAATNPNLSTNNPNIQTQGAIGGGSGGGFGNVFKTNSITPQGNLTIRNVTVKTYFTENIESGTVNANSFVVRKKGGSAVAGTFSVKGNMVEFIPTQACPGANSNLKCFDGDTDFEVILSNTIKSTSNKSLQCNITSLCKSSFKTGNLVDTNAPAVSVTYPTDSGSVSVNSIVDLQAYATDDNGISVVEFYVDNQLVNPVSQANNSNSKTFNAKTGWNTSGINQLPSKKLVKAIAKDLDSNQTTSSEIEVYVRAAHCFDNTQNADETGVDCGGNDCGACNGSQCQSNNQCQSGSCVNNSCQNVTVIRDFYPKELAQENYITVFGDSFGKFDQKTSAIYFVSGNNTKVKGIIPQQCQAAWSNNQAIVEVPQGLADGVYNLEIVTSNNCGTAQCGDDTANNSGIKLGVTIDKTKDNPSICRINPSEGEVNSKLRVEGKGFGLNKGDVLFGDFKASIGGSWDGKSQLNSISDVLVPNLQSGLIPVSVSINNKKSNPFYFRIKEPASRPVISQITPDNGGSGQYVTILGSDFGNQIGKVYIEDSVNGKQFITPSFPQECTISWWSNNSITIKIPDNIAQKKYTLAVLNYSNTQSNTVELTVNGNNPTPGICAINPIQGPFGAKVQIIGENFGTNQGKVRFQNDDSSPITQWTNGLIEAAVPIPNSKRTNSIQSVGDVQARVATSNGTLSNPSNFTVGSCQNTTPQCKNSNFECCSDGTCKPKGQCSQLPNNSILTWKFSTGNIGGNSQVSNNNNNANGNAIPYVLERNQCTQKLVQSPSPYIDSITACINSRVSAEFNTALNPVTINNSTVKIFECTRRDLCEGAASTELKGYTVNSMKTGFYVQYANNQSLKKKTWYKVQLISGPNGIKSAAPYNFEMKADYTWYFQTRDSSQECTINDVYVVPGKVTLEKKYQNESLTALPVADNCNVLDPTKYTWNWSTADNTRVTIKNDAKAVNKQIITGIKETDQKAVDVTAKVLNKANSSEVTVEFEDPRIISYTPNCNQACKNALIQAESNIELDPLSVKQHVHLYKCDTESCTTGKKSRVTTVEATTVKTVKKSTKETQYFIEFKSKSANTPLSLTENSHYQVIIGKDVKSKSGVSLTELNYDSDSDKDSINDAYSWIFKVKQGGAICEIDRVELLPTQSVVRQIEGIAAYVAEPVSVSDSCNDSGQKLDRYSYNWTWTVSPKDGGKNDERARFFPNYNQKLFSAVSTLKFNPTRAPGCGENCTKLGTYSAKAICGNGFLEPGEDCDFGTLNKQNLCSDTCQNIGTKDLKDGNGINLCGNGKVDKGEDCDIGIGNGEGCSDACLHLGSSSSYNNPSECGNGTIGIGEDCDDGNQSSFDGCSTQCLNEGALTKVGEAICGNGNITTGSTNEPGESCDFGGICETGSKKGQACNSHAQCGKLVNGVNTFDGYCLAVDNVDKGCSAQCLNLGTSKSATCGNGKIEQGEDCDLGNDNGQNKGCTTQCLLEGSAISYGSVCGDGVIGVGESCDAQQVLSSQGSPFQWVRAEKFVADKASSQTSTSRVTAQTTTNQNNTIKQASSDFVLACGLSRDDQCLASGQGVGSDSCCYPRPQVKFGSERPLDSTNIQNAPEVCTNSLMSVSFDQEMDAASFENNVILLEGHQNNCPTGLNDVTNQIALESENNADEDTFIVVAWYNSVKNYIGSLFGGNAGAAPKGVKWCESTVEIDLSLDASNKVLSIKPKTILNKNVYYKVLILGDSNLTDEYVEGVRSTKQVGFAGNGTTYKTKANSSTVFNTYDWEFKTKDICAINSISVEHSDKNDLTPYSFTQSSQSKGYLAKALDINGNELVSIPKVYEWTWDWQAYPVDLVQSQKKNESITVTSQDKNGKATLQAKASLTKSPFSGQISACSASQDCYSGICVDSGNKICDGANANCGTSSNPKGMCQLDITQSKELDLFICENPWPEMGGAYNDSTYNFSLRYCRDKGAKMCILGTRHGETCNSNTDCPAGSCVLDPSKNLPIAQKPVVRNIKGKVCVGAKVNQACSADADCIDGNNKGTCEDTGLLAEYLFPLNTEQAICHDTLGRMLKDVNTGQVITCNSDSECQKNKTGEFCYAQKGANLVSTGDAIGLRIMKNEKHISAYDWYLENIGTGVPEILEDHDGYFDVQRDTVVGYSAVREGRTKYINGSNTTNYQSAGFFTNIYLMSYNDTAGAQTIDIYNQLSNDNFKLNTNIADSDIKKSIIRDTKRLEELHSIRVLLENYKAIYGNYPLLNSGSYRGGETFSTWPSWANAFGNDLGGNLPVDPINKFAKCNGNEVTCWDEQNLSFDNSLLEQDGTLKNQSPYSYVYHYKAVNNGSSYLLDYNIEFLGQASKSAPRGGTAFQCFDEGLNSGKGGWVNNGACHSSKANTICVGAKWETSCGNGIVEAQCGEQCDGIGQNYCEEVVGICNGGQNNGQQCLADSDCPAFANLGQNNNNGILGFGNGVGNIGNSQTIAVARCDKSLAKQVTWHTDQVQSCSNECKLTPPTNTLTSQNYSCGGYCGDGILNSGFEQCEQGVPITGITCEDLGWGKIGTVGCNPNSCGYYGAGCEKGEIGSGDLRITLQWDGGALTSQTTGSNNTTSINNGGLSFGNTGGIIGSGGNNAADLDLYVIVPDQNNSRISYNNYGTIFNEPYTWLAEDERVGVNADDINGDGDKDGMELLTITQIPGKNAYYNGTYKVYVHSYTPACFAKDCTDISLTINSRDKSAQTINFTQAKGDKTQARYWHVFNMTSDGTIQVVNELKLKESDI